MTTRILFASLLSLPSLAIAHEGHGVDMASVVHYFSGPHLWVIGAAIACSATGVYYLLRRRLVKEQR